MIRHKTYPSYDSYIEHQVTKLDRQLATKTGRKVMARHDEIYRTMLLQMLEKHEFIKRGMNVLCLGARCGGEVRAFIDMGCFACGIDLNPSPQNRYVLTGDFNELQFADDSVDIVFTNCLDHAIDLQVMASELKRVLKPGGYFITQLVGDNAGTKDPYEVCQWDEIKDVIEYFEGIGFVLEGHVKVSPVFLNRKYCPWLSRHIWFKYDSNE